MSLLLPEADALIDWVCPVNWLAPLNRGLLGWWLCVPGAMGGRCWHDMVRRNNGTLADTISFGAAAPQYGRMGSIVTPSVIAGSVTLVADSSTLIPLSGGFSVAIWHRKSDTTLRASSLLGINTGVDNEKFGMHCPYLDGNIYWDFGGAVAGTSRLSVAATFSASVWDHFVFTVGPAGMFIYRNGSQIASNSANATRTATTTAVKLGGHSGTSSDICVDDDLRFYGRQLKAAEVDLLYHASRTGYQAELRRVRPSRAWEAAAAAAEYLPYDIQHSPQHQTLMAM